MLGRLGQFDGVVGNAIMLPLWSAQCRIQVEALLVRRSVSIVQSRSTDPQNIYFHASAMIAIGEGIVFSVGRSASAASVERILQNFG